MELMKGYKQTEVGVIPNEWEAELLGDYSIKIGSGITPTGGEKIYKNKGRYFIRSQNVGWGQLDLSDVAFIDDEVHNTFKTTEIKTDDIFLNITGASIGRSAMADERVVGGNVNQHVCIIRLEQKYLSPKFINYFLLSKPGQKQIDSFQSGGNRQGLNFGQIRKFLFPLPPTTKEQSSIAAVLSETDSLITSLEKLIGKKEAIRKGTMQALLTGKKRLPGFDGKWIKKELRSVLKIRHGKSQHEVFDSGGIFPIIGTGGIIGTANTFIYNKPSVLIGRKGTIDSPKYIDTPFWAIDTIFYTEISEKVNAKFIYYKFLLINWYSYNEASGVPSLNASTIEKIELLFPPTHEEQNCIVKVFEDMDQELLHLNHKLRKLMYVKQGLMQILLTGKIRLV